MTRLTGDVNNIQECRFHGAASVLQRPRYAGGDSAAVYSMNKSLSLVFFAALPVLGAGLFLITGKTGPLYGEMQEGVDTVNRIIQENLTAVRVVKSCVREEYEKEKFEEGNKRLRERSEKAFRLAALNTPLMQVVMYATILAILFYGGILIQKGSMKVGDADDFFKLCTSDPEFADDDFPTYSFL